MELPASAQDGPSCAIVAPKFGGRWDEALELERRAFRLRHGLPPGEELSVIQIPGGPNTRGAKVLSIIRHFTLCCVEDGTSIIPMFEATQASQHMSLNATARIARGNKRKAFHAQMMRTNNVIEEQRKVRDAVNINLYYANKALDTIGQAKPNAAKRREYLVPVEQEAANPVSGLCSLCLPCRACRQV